MKAIIDAFKSKKARELMARGLIASFLGMFVMACSGCGAGGGSSPAPIVQAQPKPVQITAAGDSTMAGLVKNTDGSYTVTDDTRTDLQSDLQATLGSTVTVIGHAVVGSTLPDMIAGTGSPQNYVQYLATDASRIVVENMGINDNAKDTPDAFRQSLQQFIDQTRQAGKIPVLEEPNPLCHPATAPQNIEETNAQGQTISVFVDIIDQMAAQNNAPLIAQYKPILALPNWCALMSDSWGHPSPALYAIKAQNEANVLIPIVKSLQ